ncbi:AAA-ATPase At4g25835 [Nymphaea colorata]|uniref:AAA+ ATPase domain-containing protein n=1 Tax=Nymphaea colorata TaxID=210225 RepID=A0A5K1BI48_9MAGN|nr:AAA-ATPase At4g25835 [Nymphaea colorata]
MSTQLWASLASAVGVLALFQTILSTLLPPELRLLISRFMSRTISFFSSYSYYDIAETDGVNTNELYSAVQLYLSHGAAALSGTRVSLSRPVNSSSFTLGLPSNDRLVDSFRGAPAVWEHVVTPRAPQPFSWRPHPDERRSFVLRIHKKHRPLFLTSYLDHIMEVSSCIRRGSQERLLHTHSRTGGIDSRGNPWESVPFKHPSTFDTLAMDPNLKSAIMADLRDFADGESFYSKTGRSWKRGYLLYGPPGTGKSSMIAAMANFLGYDVFDLELSEVRTNSDLRRLLMRTTSKSIVVIEDIDCSVSLVADRSPRRHNHYQHRRPLPSAADDDAASSNSVTLSGLLNFTDGLWSCCGSERLFVFTTNHIEKLDPALLRCGRMDMHIHMGYCSFEALKILLRNYVGVEASDDERVAEMAKVVDGARMTPADISEVLIRNRHDPGKALEELLTQFKTRRERRINGEEAREEEQEEQEKRALETFSEERVQDEKGGGFEEGDFGEKK